MRNFCLQAFFQLADLSQWPGEFWRPNRGFASSCRDSGSSLSCRRHIAHRTVSQRSLLSHEWNM